MAQTPKLGVLQLKTTFPRPAGDVGNPSSWPGIPVAIRVVEEADTDLVVGGGWGEELVGAFVREAEKMREDEGCVAFVTSCGFVSSRSSDLPEADRGGVGENPRVSCGPTSGHICCANKARGRPAGDDASSPRSSSALHGNVESAAGRVAATVFLSWPRLVSVCWRGHVQEERTGKSDDENKSSRD